MQLHGDLNLMTGLSEMKKKVSLVFLGFLIVFLVIGLFEFVPSVKAQEPSLPSTVWSEFPSFEPQMLTDYPSAGYLTWNTTYGLYTMDKSMYWFSFKDRYGVQQISQSVFWINTSAIIDIAKIANIQVIVQNNTMFQVKYSAQYKGGSLTKNTVIGNFTITHIFSKEQRPKISVSFVKDETVWSQGGLGDFNIVWVLLPTKAYLKINENEAINYAAKTSMDKIKETTVKEDKKCEVGDSADPSAWTGSWSLTFWDDIEGVNVLYAGLDKVFGSKGITIVFPFNNGQIDPSTVGTSTATVATWYPFQHKSFYANGRFWVFYTNGTNMVYYTSTDGTTWTVGGSSPIRAATNGYQFSVWFDGTYLHYAYTSTSSIYYRRGTPNSDGTITWSATEQTVTTTYNQAYYPMVSVDSNGYVWIEYMDYTGAYYYPYVIRSGFNNGTWGTTPSGFPYQLSTTSTSGWRVSIIPLTAGKMLAVYAYDAATVKAKKWDGSAWGTEVATTSAIYAGKYHSAVAQGDDVHLTFLKSSGYDILYVKYTYSSNSFGTETTLKAGATISSAPVLSIDTATNDLYVFAATKTTGTPSGWTANHIYYVKYTASTSSWGSWTDWIDESTEVLTYADRLTCFYKDYGSKIGLEYMTKTANPYNIRFAYLTISAGEQEYSFEFSNTVTVSASSSISRALMFTKTETASIITTFSKEREWGFFQTETIETTTQSFKWGEYSIFQTETILPTVSANFWKELLFFSMEITETVTVYPSSSMVMWRELLFSFPNTMLIDGLSQIWKELKITQIEFFEVVTPHSQTFWFTEYPPIDLALVLAAFAVVMAIIAIGLVATKKD
jgi:hypothetical protein